MKLIVPILLAILTTSFCTNSMAQHSPQSSILVITDIHFSPFAACQTQKHSCSLINKLEQAKSSQWSNIFLHSNQNQNHLAYYGQETNYTLLTSLLKEITKLHPKAVLILGDFLAHNYYANFTKYSANASTTNFRFFTLKTYQFLMQQLKANIPSNTPVYMAMGNNDAYYNAQCYNPDYCVISHGALFADLSHLWAPFLTNLQNQQQFQQTFPIAGYYSVTLNKHPQIQLIVLNTVSFSTKAQGDNVANAAQQQLLWLNQQLAKAYQNHQNVWLAMHIPPGIDAYATYNDPLQRIITFWKPAYLQQFLSLMQQYHSIIKIILSGHMHTDGFRVIAQPSQQPIVDSYIPSISPIFKNNPGFKIYSFTTTDGTILDYTTYFLPLSSQSPTWHQEYNFKQTYLADCPHCPFHSVLQRIQPSPTNQFTQRYIQYFLVQTPQRSIKKLWYPDTYCAMHHLTANQFKQCLENTNQTTSSKSKLLRIISNLLGIK